MVSRFYFLKFAVGIEPKAGSTTAMQVYAELPQPEHIIIKINAYEKKVYCATTPAHTHHEQLLLEQTDKSGSDRSVRGVCRRNREGHRRITRCGMAATEYGALQNCASTASHHHVIA